MRPFILFLFCPAFFIACQSRADKIKEYLEKTCDCKHIEVERSNRSGFDYITYNMEECKYKNDFAEAEKIINGLREKLPETCAMEEKLVFQFYRDGKYYPHVYWKCTPQFEF